MKLPFKIYIYFYLVCCFSFSISFAQAQDSSYSYTSSYKIEAGVEEVSDTSSYIVERKNLIKNALQHKTPILLEFKNNPFNDSAFIIQQIAFADSNIHVFFSDTITKATLLNQVFGIYYTRPGNLPNYLKYEKGRYFQIEIYNFAYNLSIVGIVDYKERKVVSVTTLAQSQPDVPNAISQLAILIAINNKEVEKALGFKPDLRMPVMTSTKTALNKTRCERSMHLCLAPTFVIKNRALWAIVDITDLKLVGLRWTNLGNQVNNEMLTERKIQNENIQDCYCEKVNQIKKKHWEIDYVLTSSDGLKIFNAKYKDKLIINSAKLVDWHVNYSNTDGFGYSDAVGCPMFSQSAVVATEPPQIIEFVEDKEEGFYIEQRFYSEKYPTPCNYSYSQKFIFYKNGDFRTAVGSLGRGCGNDGTYRPVLRIELASNKQTVKEWQNNSWKIWQHEQWQLQKATTSYTKEGFQYKVDFDENTSYMIEPGKGQFKDGGRGDNAYLYVTKNHPTKQEGNGDLITIGPCCNTDYKQGPEKFIDAVPENIVNTDIVLWYVPQLKNNDAEGAEYCWAKVVNENGIYKVKAFPCFAGPKFKLSKR